MTITHYVTVKQHGYTNKSILIKTKLGRDIIYADKNKIGDRPFLHWLETGGQLFILSKYNMGRDSINLDQKHRRDCIIYYCTIIILVHVQRKLWRKKNQRSTWACTAHFKMLFLVKLTPLPHPSQKKIIWNFHC